MVKAGTVLIVAGLGVVGLIAYLAYKVLKPVVDTASQVDASLKGVTDGFGAIAGEFGAADHFLRELPNQFVGGVRNVFGRTSSSPAVVRTLAGGQQIVVAPESQIIDPTLFHAPPVTSIYGPNPITTSQKRLFGGY